MNSFKKTALLLVLSILSSSTLSCQLDSSSKAYLKPLKYEKKHDLVFIGEVVTIQEGNPQKADFKIIEILKGQRTSPTIQINNLPGTCTAAFRKVGDKYVVFANKNEESTFSTKGVFFGLTPKLTLKESAKISILKSK